MRITANLNLLDDLFEFNRSFFATDRGTESVLGSAVEWLENNIKDIKTECKALLLDVACNQKIAQSQLDIVRLVV